MKCPKCGGDMSYKTRSVNKRDRTGQRTPIDVKNWQCDSCGIWRGSAAYWKAFRDSQKPG